MGERITAFVPILSDRLIFWGAPLEHKNYVSHPHTFVKGCQVLCRRRSDWLEA